MSGKSGPRPGNCKILEQKYCDKIVLIDNPNLSGSKIAAAKLPVGAPIFSIENTNDSHTLLDRSGAVSFDNFKTAYPSISIDLNRDGSWKSTYRSYQYVFYPKISTGSILSKGDEVGTVSEKTIDKLGDYNFVFLIYNSSGGKLSEANNILKGIVKK